MGEVNGGVEGVWKEVMGKLGVDIGKVSLRV